MPFLCLRQGRVHDGVQTLDQVLSAAPLELFLTDVEEVPHPLRVQHRGVGHHGLHGFSCAGVQRDGHV